MSLISAFKRPVSQLWLAVLLSGLSWTALAAREVRVGVYGNEPKIFADANGQLSGIFGDLINEIARREGWTLVPVPCAWEDCLRALQDGGLDLMPDVAYNEARARLFDFHRIPALHSWSQLYRHEGVSIVSMTDLQGKRVAVLDGSVQQEYLSSLLAGFGLRTQLVAVPSLREGFARVERGELDAVAANHHFGDRNARAHQLQETPIMFLPSRLFFATSQGRNAELLAAIDHYLQSWQGDASSIYFTVLKRWGLPPVPSQIPSYLWWSLASVATLLVLALGTAVWLRREVARQTRYLRASEDRLSTILNSVDGYIFIKDMQLRYQYVNQKVAELFGRPADAIIGCGDEDFLDPATVRALHETDRRVIDGGERVAGEDLAVTQDGRTRRLYYSVKLPLRDAEGRIYALCGISTDITELKQAQVERETFDAMRRAKEIAEQAAHAKADFLANMSHEIRTPMNAVIGMTYLLQKTPLTPRQLDHLHKIQVSSQHLLGVINDILDFSKIEANRMSLEQVEFELEPVLDNVINLLAERAARKSIELVLEIAPDVPTRLVGDPLRLGQVLINLANNAVKFTECGTVSLRILLQARSEAGVLLRFEVRDTGIGISPEQRDRLFQSFEQADSSITRRYGGSGLGLAISKRLAELMGGEVGVESVPGRGSTFWFTARLGLGSGQTARPALQSSLLDRRMLVVDDNEQAREVQAGMLRAMGFDVTSVESGPLALVELERSEQVGQPYDIVFLDWKMPGMDGLSVAREIARLRLSQQPRVLMVTAYDRDELAQAATDVQIHDVLVKPVTPSTLLDAVMRLLGVWQVTAHALPPGAAAGLDSATLRGARALLVEDNEINQEVGQALLAELGLQVELASDGAVALAKVQQHRYDVVLMDLQMPVMDGLTATREIRKLDALKDLPILAMTANAMAGDRERCLEAGMQDHIAKPIDPNDLAVKLLKWIRPGPRSAPPAEADGAVERVAGVRAEAETPIAPSLAGIAGLDVAQGLRQLQGREALYLKLLRKFVSDQADMPERLQAAIAAGDWGLAERLAHTVKGVAAQIGALPLRESAERLEQALRERQSMTVIEPLQQAISIGLPPLIAAIAAQLAPVAVVAPVPFDAQRWQRLRERLISLLEQDDTESEALLDGEEALLRTGLGERFDAVAQAIRNFDFPAALAVMRGRDTTS